MTGEKTKPLVSKIFGAGIKLAIWENITKDKKKFVTVELTRSYKIGEKWIEKKMSGLTMKSLDALQNAITFAKNKIATMEEK